MSNEASEVRDQRTSPWGFERNCDHTHHGLRRALECKGLFATGWDYIRRWWSAHTKPIANVMVAFNVFAISNSLNLLFTLSFNRMRNRTASTKAVWTAIATATSGSPIRRESRRPIHWHNAMHTAGTIGTQTPARDDATLTTTAERRLLLADVPKCRAAKTLSGTPIARNNQKN